MVHKKSPSIYGYPSLPMWSDKNGKPTFEIPDHVAEIWREIQKIMATKQCSKSQAIDIYFKRQR